MFGIKVKLTYIENHHNLSFLEDACTKGAKIELRDLFNLIMITVLCYISYLVISSRIGRTFWWVMRSNEIANRESFCPHLYYDCAITRNGISDITLYSWYVHVHQVWNLLVNIQWFSYVLTAITSTCMFRYLIHLSVYTHIYPF